jgi:hypothetical protein
MPREIAKMAKTIGLLYISVTFIPSIQKILPIILACGASATK